MRKFLAAVILMMLMPITAHAHSGLSSSTPAEGESLDVAPTEILFEFDAPIQQGDMSITEASGNAFEFSDVNASESELRGEFSEALPDGAYTVSWSVISEDSHEVTGTLAFNVAAEAEEEVVEEESVAEEAVEEEAATEEAEEATASADETANAGIPWVTMLIISALLIAAVAFFAVARRK